MTPDQIKLDTAEKILRRLLLIEQQPERMIRALVDMIDDLRSRMP